MPRKRKTDLIPAQRQDISPYRADLITSHHIVCDAIKESWIGYRDPSGQSSTSPNPFMSLRTQWNWQFGIKNVKDLDGDPERQLLYSLANIRAQKAITHGVAQNLLRSEIRQATYAEFRKAKELL